MGGGEIQLHVFLTSRHTDVRVFIKGHGKTVVLSESECCLQSKLQHVS